MWRVDAKPIRRPIRPRRRLERKEDSQHNTASHLLENGMDVRMIQEFLSHETLKTTQIYARVTLKGLRKHYNRTHPKEKRIRKIEREAAE